MLTGPLVARNHFSCRQGLASAAHFLFRASFCSWRHLFKLPVHASILLFVGVLIRLPKADQFRRAQSEKVCLIVPFVILLLALITAASLKLLRVRLNRATPDEIRARADRLFGYYCRSTMVGKIPFPRP